MVLESGYRDGKAKRMSLFPTFLAIDDQYVILAGRNISW
jgi:hypothetical protein